MKTKKDIRPEIKNLHKDISGVVSRPNGVLEITYYDNKEDVMDLVSRHLIRKDLFQCFVKVDFMKVPRANII